MENGVVKKLILILLSLACVMCVVGIGFVVFDSVRQATGSHLNGYGALAVFVMVAAMAGRWVWQQRAS